MSAIRMTRRMLRKVLQEALPSPAGSFSVLLAALRAMGLNVDSDHTGTLRLHDTSATVRDAFYETISDHGFVVVSGCKLSDGSSVTVSSDPANIRASYMFTPDAVDREWFAYQAGILQKFRALLPQYAELQAAIVRQPEWAEFCDGMASITQFMNWIFLSAYDVRLTQPLLLDQFMEVDSRLRELSDRLIGRYPGLLSVARQVPPSSMWSEWLTFFVNKIDELKERAFDAGGD